MSHPTTYYIANGFRDDCKDIIEAFSKENSLKFSAFAKVWRQMKFELIFSGRQSLSELCEFSEEIMGIVGEHILLDSANLYHQIAAVYLAHSLRLCQPIGKLPNIRIVPASAESLKRLYEVLKDTLPDTTEALYVFCSLMRDGVFRYVMTKREYGIEKSYRKYLEDTNWPPAPNIKVGLDHLAVLASPGTGQLHNLASLSKFYHDAKCKLPGGSKDNPPKELNYVDKNFETDLIKSLHDLIDDSKEKPFEGHKEGVLKRTSEKTANDKSGDHCSKSTRFPKKKIILKPKMMDHLEYILPDIDGGSRGTNNDADDSNPDDPMEAPSTDMPDITLVYEDETIDLTSI